MSKSLIARLAAVLAATGLALVLGPLGVGHPSVPAKAVPAAAATPDGDGDCC
ncbi:MULTISPECIES: hypothetical protein [Kitasatospora]|jgi:hypothetical protein|uniref:hypothetical protein n=1 Tax=Kitasatospora TaxID=2063 RepID=UPI000ABDC7A1|nr:hypothetical protein [Kitasatospora sp. NRRL B-11411]